LGPPDEDAIPEEDADLGAYRQYNDNWPVKESRFLLEKAAHVPRVRTQAVFPAERLQEEVKERRNS